jgi:hypothetical protein
MSRTAMIALVCLAAYCLLDLLVSSIVALLWRTRAVAPAHLPPTVRARRILLLRITPVAVSLTITLLVVAPAFALFEPAHHEEQFGPLFAICALVALARFAASCSRGGRSLWLTNRVEREWRGRAKALEVAHPQYPPRPGRREMRAFIIDASSPIVALVGVISPRLLAARSVIEACTPDEIATIVGHERGHFESRDNFKRWLMSLLPDALRHTRIHGEMLEAWHHAAEDAADDATTNGDAQARANLAALLLKVVRLAPNPLWNSAVVSPFVEHHGLERRVRRLLRAELEPPAPLALAPMIAIAIIAAAVVTTVSSPSMLRMVFLAFESLVALGR